MSPPIRINEEIDEELRRMIEVNIHRLINERKGQRSLDLTEQKDSISDAITSMRVSINTRNKLKKHLRPQESYEELIVRLMEEIECLQEKLKELKSIQKEANLISYSKAEFLRVHKTYSFHPDLKVEYSYNSPRSKFENNFSFNLIIDNYILDGKVVNEEKGVQTIQTINIIQSLNNIHWDTDAESIINTKLTQLRNKEEYISAKYLIYFRILYNIIIDKLDVKINELNFLNRDFWENLYISKAISRNSLDEDVIRKLRRYESEIQQFKVDNARYSVVIK